MNNFDKHRSGVQASRIVRKLCGRCGTAIEGNNFCPACRDFFWRLAGQKVVIATAVGRTQRYWARINGK